MRADLSPRRCRRPARANARISAVLAAILLLFSGNPAFAIITGFLPGDAFGSWLSEDTLSQFECRSTSVMN